MVNPRCSRNSAFQGACTALVLILITPAATAEEPSVTGGADASQLSKVQVKDSALNDATTEGSGYAAPATTIGKDVRALRELPHSITIVTRQQLTDQNISTIEGALKNVTGVTIQRFDATGTYTQFIARGYAADIYQLDGLTLQTDANGTYFDLAAYDRVEVQRGSAGLFSGGGEPGITVNMARKRALSEPRVEGALMLGSWQDRRLEADLRRPLNDAGSLRGRAVTVLQSFDTFMDGIDDNEKKLFYGTLERDLGERATLSAGVTWQSVDTVLSRGLPTFADAQLIDMPRSTMLVMDWNEQDLDSRSAFVELECRGDDDALLKLSVRHLNRKNEAAYIDPAIPAADGTMTGLSTSAFARDDTDDTFDFYYSKSLQWGGRAHSVLVGADYRRTGNDSRYAPYTTLVSGSVNLFDFDPGAIPRPDFDFNTNVTDTEITSYGTYGQVRFRATSAWTLIGGGRLSWWESNSVSHGVTSAYAATAELTPYLATIVDLTPTLSLYGSFNQIFKPQNARTVSGEQIEPRIGRQVELGLKGEAAGGQLLYTAALYRLNDENRAIADPTDDNFSIPSGKARAQGFEVDVRGELSPRWAVSGGYAYTDTEYLRSTDAQQGQPVSSISPEHAGNLWVRYKIKEHRLRGLELGAGVRAVGDFYNGTAPLLVRGQGYTLISLSGSLRLSPRYQVTLNVDNLLDETYWEKVSYPGRQNFFGEPRRVSVALRGSW
jgi:TonB-dependent siderophore receptor